MLPGPWIWRSLNYDGRDSRRADREMRRKDTESRLEDYTVAATMTEGSGHFLKGNATDFTNQSLGLGEYNCIC